MVSNSMPICLSCLSTFLSSDLSCVAMFLLEARISRGRTNARMMEILTSAARELESTLESIATPCSVNASGGVRRPPRPSGFDITFCDIKDLYSSISLLPQTQMGRCVTCITATPRRFSAGIPRHTATPGAWFISGWNEGDGTRLRD